MHKVVLYPQSTTVTSCSVSYIGSFTLSVFSLSSSSSSPSFSLLLLFIHDSSQYINGGTLEELIRDLTHPFLPSLRINLALDVAHGMAYLHRNRMLHRDLNSHNCLLRKDGEKYTAVVADFGLAAESPSIVK